MHKHRQFVKSVALLRQILKLGLIFIRAINFESVISYSRCKSVADRGLDDIARATEQRSCEPCCRMKISIDVPQTSESKRPFAKEPLSVDLPFSRQQ